MHLFLKRSEILTKNILAIKKLQQDLKKTDENQRGGQSLCRNAVDHIKNLIMMTPRYHNVLWPGSSLSKFLRCSTAFLGHPFWFHIFFISDFSGLGCNLFTARVGYLLSELISWKIQLKIIHYPKVILLLLSSRWFLSSFIRKCKH